MERLREALHLATDALDAIDMVLCTGSRKRYTIEGVQKTTRATLKALAALAASREPEPGIVPGPFDPVDRGAIEPEPAADGASEGSAVHHPLCDDGMCVAGCTAYRNPPPELDDVEGAATAFVTWHAAMSDSETMTSDLAVLLRTREAAAKRQGVREGWERVIALIRSHEGGLHGDASRFDVADWLDARKPVG